MTLSARAHLALVDAVAFWFKAGKSRLQIARRYHLTVREVEQLVRTALRRSRQ